MLTLPPFTWHAPTSLDEALSLLARHGGDAKLVAGGTDLLPNMKNGLLEPAHLISLASIPALRGTSIARTNEGEVLHVGAMTPLAEVAKDARIVEAAPALAEAAGAVGGPHHRRMGTLGGNLCLDTRCRFFNQSRFWREALGGCLKKEGAVCHVVPGGKRCVAAASNDTAAAAIVLDAVAVVVGPSGEREVPMRELYVADGVRNTRLATGDIVVELRLPCARSFGSRGSAYEKLRRRGAIDFPLLSIAARIDLDPSDSHGAAVDEGARVRSLAVVVSALAARPRVIEPPELVGRRVAELDVDAIAAAVHKVSSPLPNVDGDVEWRREMVRPLAKRALARALESARGLQVTRNGRPTPI